MLSFKDVLGMFIVNGLIHFAYRAVSEDSMPFAAAIIIGITLGVSWNSIAITLGLRKDQ